MMARTTIGLDVGYGVTKCVNGQVITFPSVAGYARQLKFQEDKISAKYPGDQVIDNDGNWFVGNLALSQLNPASLIRLRGRTGEEEDGNSFRLRMMKVALGKLFAGTCDGNAIHIAVATGLPVDHMIDAERLKLTLHGSHLVKTDTANFVANITDVIVMPQPYGTIYRHLINERGQLDEYYTVERTGVIDVGTYTTDLTLDDDGEYIDERSGSVEAGVSVIQDVGGLNQILKKLKKESGISSTVSPHRIRHMFAREYLNNAGDLATLSRLMGHSDISTTANSYAVFTNEETAEKHERHSPLKGGSWE